MSEREREILEVSRDCRSKLWIISSDFEPNTHLSEQKQIR